MKIEKIALAENLLLGLIPKFKGLTEKSAKKMIAKLDKTAFNLSKVFFKLQERDLKYSLKLEKKNIKEQKKRLKKANNKSKVSMILGLEKPKNLVEIPEKTPSKKPIKKNPSKLTKISLN